MVTDTGVSLAAIEDAAARLQSVAVRTPLLVSAELDEAVGGKVFVKPECLQRTGSFKIRGAYNLMSRLDATRAARGVVAWSSGNHAQGVAAAGALLGIRTAIVGDPKEHATTRLLARLRASEAPAGHSDTGGTT